MQGIFRVTYIVASVSGYFILSAAFLKVLLNPENDINFIYNQGILIYFVEFLTIAHMLVLNSKRDTHGNIVPVENKKIVTVGILISGLGLAVLSKNIYIILTFSISILIKSLNYFRTLKEDNNKLVVLTVLLFMATVFLVLFFREPIRNFIPFSALVLNAKPKNVSGIFTEVPQALLVWGVLYYCLLGILEALFLVKVKPKG